jgi:hypothetical protein
VEDESRQIRDSVHAHFPVNSIVWPRPSVCNTAVNAVD